MKSVKLLFAIIFFLVASAVAQDMQYVSKQSGDSLWVKDDIDFADINTLYLLMASDSLAPASRVYVLKANGIYSLANNPVSSPDHRTVIMGETTGSVKTSQGDAPPVISGANTTSSTTSGGMNIAKDLLIKNVSLEIGNTAGNTSGWAWFNFNGPGYRLQVDNCMLEHTWWVWVGGPPADVKVIFTNSYMVNLSGHSCRRNGGVVDFNGAGTHLDSLVVENCTHVNNQGTLYKFRKGWVTGKAIFNHNNFINNSGYVIMSNGNTANMSVTNNIYVNTQLQAYCPVLYSADVGEVDEDGLPMGLVNVRDDSTFQANGANFYSDRNLAYWDPSLSDIASTLNTNSVNGNTQWVSQMIPMNSRTESLFNDDENYPLVTNGTWYNKLPTFADTKDLFTDQLAVLKAFSIATVDTSYGTPMDSWRQPGNGEAGNFIFADWPCPIDLSYSDSDLMTAGLGGFPLGDLNWFPSEYEAWEAQKAAEYDHIDGVLDGSIMVGIKTVNELPGKFELRQNYPNPFNPETKIKFTLSAISNVKLAVYNALGQQITTLVNKKLGAGEYEYTFNASNLASGIYLYRLESDNFVQQKKMILIK
jgi:Secretion system C-terminal sorting domain